MEKDKKRVRLINHMSVFDIMKLLWQLTGFFFFFCFFFWRCKCFPALWQHLCLPVTCYTVLTSYRNAYRVSCCPIIIIKVLSGKDLHRHCRVDKVGLVGTTLLQIPGVRPQTSQTHGHAKYIFSNMIESSLLLYLICSYTHNEVCSSLKSTDFESWIESVLELNWGLYEEVLR